MSKMLMRMLIMVTVFMATLTATAQTETYTGTVGAHACGKYFAIWCDGIPMIIDNGTELVNESVWITYYNAGNMLVWPVDPLGLDNPNGFAHFTTTPIPTLSKAPGQQTMTLAFAGTDGKGKPYTGTLVLNYEAYFQSGRYGGWRWLVTGGTVSVRRV